MTPRQDELGREDYHTYGTALFANGVWSRWLTPVLNVPEDDEEPFFPHGEGYGAADDPVFP